MDSKLKSRKFWLALLGALLPIVAQALTGEVGWTEAASIGGTVLVSYIFGQAYVDGKKAQGALPAAPAKPKDGGE